MMPARPGAINGPPPQAGTAKGNAVPLRDRSSIGLSVLVIVLVLRVAGPATANLSWVVVAAYALLGRAQAVQALGMLWLMIMLSSGLAPPATGLAVGRYAVLAAAAVSVGVRGGVVNRDMRVSAPVLLTALLGAFLVLHSAFFSVEPVVSLLKSVSWAIAAITLVAAWNGLSRVARVRLELQLFGAFVALLLVSVPLMGSSVGYLRNGTGFQGILGQPQAFGAAIAVLGGWLVGSLLCDRAPSWLRVALPGAAATAIVLSESRTAALALVGGVLLGVVLVRSSVRGPSKVLFPGLRSTRLRLALVTLGIVVLGSGSVMGQRTLQFIQKRTDSTSLIDAYDSSRGAKMHAMWDNIQEVPLLGIGFGIASDPSSMVLERDSLFGIPTGAVVEKGVLPIAVLEEVGIVGAVLVAAWIVVLVRRAGRGGVRPAIVTCTALLTNMGEATLFSPGGFGLIVLLVVAWGGTTRRPAETPSHA